MPALGKVRSDVAGRQPGWLIPIHPVACLAFGGLLTVAWCGALTLCAYNLVCWLVG
jgi:hypothetical protein